MTTGFVWHEKYMWHHSGTGAGLMPHGPIIQPGRYMENAEAKRRFRNLLETSGLLEKLITIAPRDITMDELLSVHTQEYIDRIKSLSDESGGDAGFQAPFGQGDFEIALLAAGGVLAAANAVVDGDVDNAYALVRPIGHHASADFGMGYCIFNNAAIAGRQLLDHRGLERIAYVDWDVHHGNGTQNIFYAEPRALTISIHQENWLPPNSGHITEQGEGPGKGYNINVPLPPGSGTAAYEAVFDRIVIPAFKKYKPDLIFVPSGFDAGVLDPLARMLLHSEGFRSLTNKLLGVAEEVCNGRLVMSQEGGYCDATSPFYGLSIMEALSGESTGIVDPYLELVMNMGGQELQAHQEQRIKECEPLLERLDC